MQANTDNQLLSNLQDNMDEPDPMTFLENFRFNKEQADMMLNKPMRPDVDVRMDIIQRDIEQLRNSILKAPALEGLLRIKDEIIWQLTHGSTTPSPRTGSQVTSTKSSAREDPTATYQAELEEWAKLVDSYAEELDKGTYKCALCGVVVDPKSINTDCPRNTSYSFVQPAGNIIVPENLKMKNRHVFMQLDALGGGSNIAFSLLKKVTNLATIFGNYDLMGTGEISTPDFIHVLTTQLKMPEEQALNLVHIYENVGKIDYKSLTADLQDESKIMEQIKTKATTIRYYLKGQDAGGIVNPEQFKTGLKRAGIGSGELDQAYRLAQMKLQGNIPYEMFLNQLT